MLAIELRASNTWARDIRGIWKVDCRVSVTGPIATHLVHGENGEILLCQQLDDTLVGGWSDEGD